jgi:hypothetical protein
VVLSMSIDDRLALRGTVGDVLLSTMLSKNAIAAYQNQGCMPRDREQKLLWL